MSSPMLKFCGVRTRADLITVADSMADYIGFIFAESKRKVDPNEVKAWLKDVDIKNKKLVAVFVNPTSEELAEVNENIPIDVIQFHGNESLDTIKDASNLYNVTVWKALHHHPGTLEEMEMYRESVEGYVIDSRIKGQWGGTGVSFDWAAVPEYIKFSARHNKLCFIAGGVNKSNIEKLLTYDPHGIDLSSGIEQEERKNKGLIKQIEERVLRHANISR